MTFEEAVAQSKQLPSRPSDDILLKIYSLYKQATEGDVQGERTEGFDFKGMAKYDAWAELQGKPKEEATQEYVSLIEELS